MKDPGGPHIYHPDRERKAYVIRLKDEYLYNRQRPVV